MPYHPHSLRSLRTYQQCQRDRLKPYPAADAADDYAGALEFQASEPAGLYADPVTMLRRHTRAKARDYLAACRRARAAMATGGWRGDDAPLSLAYAQADLWRVRDYRRAYVAAAAQAEARG